MTLLCAVSMLGFVSCVDSEDSMGHNGGSGAGVDTLRTSLLIYMMAENNLNSYAARDMEEISAVAATVPADCGLFVFIDDVMLPRLLRYYNNNGLPECDTLYAFEEDFCSSDINNMADVCDILLERFNMCELNLIMWSHGDGWLLDKSRKSVARAIGHDNCENSAWGGPMSKGSIEMKELAGLIDSLPVDVKLLMYDACFMQCIESVYELRNSVDYILASPAEIPGAGAPYNKIIPLFFADVLDVEDVMMEYYNFYKSNSLGVLLSVVDCRWVEEFADATMPYIAKYFSGDVAFDYEKIFSYIDGGYFYGSYSYPDFFDMNGVMMHCLSDEEYKEWRAAFDKMVPYSCCTARWMSVYSYYTTGHDYYYTDTKQYSGVSMYLPREEAVYGGLNEDFRTTGWYERVGWTR